MRLKKHLSCKFNSPRRPSPAGFREESEMKIISQCNQKTIPQVDDPELLDYICQCKYTCPGCDRLLCGGDYLIDANKKQGIFTTDVRGDPHGDQSMGNCPHCGVNIWSSMECGDWL